MRIINFLTVIAIMAVICSGCAEVDVPRTSDLFEDPLGKGSVKIGMTQDQVISIYGVADTKRTVVSGEWNGKREEWFYEARYSALPVNAGYLAKDIYLYFDGKNLTNISGSLMGKDPASGLEKETDGFIK
ncbi:MAG: hypothetical protein P9L90_00990 [Candidatus Aadella gelida]|nr:hypothetical protein [Candidatus Aadella gelida]